MTSSDFDRYAQNYAGELNQWLAVTGETVEYYARERIKHVALCLRSRNVQPRQVVDFGCGSGTAIPFFFEYLHAQSIVGLDVSTESLRVAALKYADLRVQFVELAHYRPAGDADLAFCNGVFHHIPPPQRLAALKTIADSLCVGGHFAFWENNPWNPGTQWLMHRVPFDRDAIKVSSLAARRLLKAAGFRILQIDYMFYFPKFLQILRPLEKLLQKIPLGGQYMVLAVKPAG